MPMDVSATCNSPCFIYTKAEIAASPSIVDGMSPADEQSIRSYEMDKIAYYGIELTHSKEMVYTSMMLWHRFYIRRSLRAYDPALLSVACLLLSSKICETLRFLKEERYLRDFVRIYLHRKEGLRAIDFETSQAVEAKEAIVVAERELLRAIEYDFEVELPLPHVASICDTLHASEATRKFASRAVTDIMKSTLPLRYSARELAEGAVVMAFRLTGCALPLETSLAYSGSSVAESSVAQPLSTAVLCTPAMVVDDIIATVQLNAAAAAVAASSAVNQAWQPPVPLHATTSTSPASLAPPLPQEAPLPPPPPAPVTQSKVLVQPLVAAEADLAIHAPSGPR